MAKKKKDAFLMKVLIDLNLIIESFTYQVTKKRQQRQVN